MHDAYGVSRLLRSILSYLPGSLQLWISKAYYGRRISQVGPEADSALQATKILVSHGDTVLDIGANVGLWGRYLSLWVGDKGKVFSFEPVPNTYAILRHVVNRFKLKNVEAFCLGISDCSTTARMTLPNDDRGYPNHYLAKVMDNDFIETGFKVQLETLDKWAARSGLESVGFIKIDTEGHELKGLQGGQNVLSRFSPMLCVEINDGLLQSQNGRDILQYLQGFGYAPYIFSGEAFEQADTRFTTVNYFFFTTEHLQSIPHEVMVRN